MVAVVIEHVVLAACPLFGQFFQYFYKVFGFHPGLSQINFAIELVISSLRINNNKTTLTLLSGNDTITILLVTGCIEKRVLDLNPSMITTQTNA